MSVPSTGFLLLCAITFLSAFLLFQIELITAKLFLPIYGGSYLVWGGCVVFFQGMLLAGYVLAHRLIDQLGIKKYLTVHIVLLFLPFLFFPGKTIRIDSSLSNLPLVADIFVRLLQSIGPVFLVLSTISLITQTWLATSKTPQKNHPYILYAVSNIGSFAALWSYPFIFEYFLTNGEQLNIWRAAYVGLVLLNLLAWRLLPVANQPKKEKSVDAKVSRGTLLRWLILSAAGVVLFLSVTNIITYEIAPVPLLWIIPLSIYLLSFVLCFKTNPWFPGWMRPLSAVVLGIGVLLYFQIKMTFLPAAWAIICFSLILFVLCLFAQHELIRTKPKTENLTLFYVVISLGGFVGGFVTSWIVPLVSHAPVEFLLGLTLIAVVYPVKKIKWILLAIVSVSLIIECVINPRGAILRKRNYYGIYEVYDKNGVRTFVHGTTLHGVEWIDPQRRVVPLGYYSPMSPMGQVFIKDIFAAKRVGAVGLGAGTMAMFSRPDLAMDFYELDPDVVKIAEQYFWYLRLAPGQPMRVAVGDARISLTKSWDTIYDVLVIDAFGGDSVPVHLLNKDVLWLYRQRLTERGGILFHIPNRYFNLEAVVAGIAAQAGAYAAIKEAKQDGITLHTFWAVITWDRERYDRLIGEEGWMPLRLESYGAMRVWSDDYSSILPILKFDELWASLKHYKLF